LRIRCIKVSVCEYCAPVEWVRLLQNEGEFP